MATMAELKATLKKVILAIFPEFAGDYHYPIRAKVVGVRETGGKLDEFNRRYAVDVQPLHPDGTVNEAAPVIPDVEIPLLWAGPNRGIFCLPVVGAVVRLGYYYNDPAYPFVDAVLGDGFNVPNHPLGSLIIQHSEGTRIEIDKDQNIRITNPGSSPKIYFYTGDHPVAFADVVKAIYDSHTHPYSWTDPGGSGSTGPPEQAMEGHDSPKVFTG